VFFARISFEAKPLLCGSVTAATSDGMNLKEVSPRVLAGSILRREQVIWHQKASTPYFAWPSKRL
jgi:hypothetical protein